MGIALRFIGMNDLYRESFLLESGEYDFWNMFVVSEGSFLLGDEVIHPGEVAVFAPRVPFERHVMLPIRFLSIHFALQGAVTSAIPCGKLSFRDKQRVLSTAAMMRAVWEKGRESELMQHLFEDIWAQYEIEQKHTEQEKPYHPVVSQALSALSVDSPPEIAALAAQLGVSHAYLIRLFKRFLGQTPQAFVIGRRMERARALLLDTAYSIQEIAQACGFENTYYFSNAFKKHTGLSPTAFRSTYQA